MMTKISFDKVQDYLISLVPPREAEMKKMEQYAKKTDFPIIGPAAGYVCYQIARMIGAKFVCELGSGYGYSTAWFAKAVKENDGQVVHHIVWDEKLSEMARGHLSRLGFNNLIQYHVAEAVQTLRTLPGPFDLIFNDIDKEGYPESLPLIKQKLRRGGVLIIDNMLWHGQILDPKDQEKSTRAIRQFTKTITADPDWIVSLAPVRDGMIVAYKN
jgi:caffeoyl-CoA O-methyltransferase